jgi:hypothetical protein
MKQIGEGKIQSTYTKCGYLIEIHDDVLEIAKEIEKKQIEKAFFYGCAHLFETVGDLPHRYKNASNYYNKEYNNG